MRSFAILFVSLAAAAAFEVIMDVDPSAIECHCDCGRSEFEQIEDKGRECDRKKYYYKGSGSLGGWLNRKRQSRDYCSFDRMNWLTSDKKNVEFPKLDDFVAPMVRDLGMDVEHCKDKSREFLLDSDDDHWYENLRDWTWGENYDYNGVSMKITTFLDCLKEEREKSCPQFVAQKLMRDACPTV